MLLVPLEALITLLSHVLNLHVYLATMLLVQGVSKKSRQFGKTQTSNGCNAGTKHPIYLKFSHNRVYHQVCFV